jgi:hypothetical protein
MAEKIRKTLYLPVWVCDLIDREGNIYDGPGVVAAAAIHYFAGLSVAQKKRVMEAYRRAEIENAYADEVVDDAEADAALKQKQTPGHRSADAQ